jgi:hypothetical protein
MARRDKAYLPAVSRMEQHKEDTNMISDNLYVAIDPMALILSGKAYLIWVEQHHPHVPKVSEIQEALRGITADERKGILNRTRNLADYAKAVEEAITTMK